MSGAQAVKDTSMEDILASIRKIIEEDDGTPKDAEAGEESERSMGTVAKSIASDENEAPRQARVSLSQQDDDDTVVLTADLRDKKASERLHSKQDSSAREPLAVIEAQINDEISDEADEDAEFELIKGAGDGDLTFGDPEPVSIKPASPPIKSVHTSERLDSDSLIGPDASVQVMNSLAAFSRIKAPSGEQTMEDFMMSLLKPMLKAWLDDNLPAIVERKVEAELKRLSGE